MFRPPPTIIEIGTEDDLKQFKEIMEKNSSPTTPTPKRNQVFDSPDPIFNGRNLVSTPTGSVSSPN